MSDFKPFKLAVQAQFDKMCKTGLFKTFAAKDDMWILYLSSFPEGTNPNEITFQLSEWENS